MLRFLFALAVLQSSLTCAISQDSPRNCRERYRKELDTNPKSSSAHFLLGTRNLLKFLAQRNPMLGLRSAGRAQLRYAQVRYLASSAHEPPRRTR